MIYICLKECCSRCNLSDLEVEKPYDASGPASVYCTHSKVCSAYLHATDSPAYGFLGAYKPVPNSKEA